MENSYLELNMENPYFFANNTESPFLIIFSLGQGVFCQHRSNCPERTEKPNEKSRKGKNKITLREMKKRRIQNFFQTVKSIYGLPYFKLKNSVFWTC